MYKTDNAKVGDVWATLKYITIINNVQQRHVFLKSCSSTDVTSCW